MEFGQSKKGGLNNLKKKVCKKCGIEKYLDDFSFNKEHRDGKNPWCKQCSNDYSLKWRIKNKKRAREHSRNWFIKNREKAKESSSKWCSKNKEKVLERKRRLQRYSRKIPKNKLNKNIGTSIGISLKGNKGGCHWETLVGYKLDDLKYHLQKKFLPGMNWGNYGMWHIDHIIPISAFNFEGPEDIDFKRCWSLKNLRPLWATENIKKHAKLNSSFQPSLRIGEIKP